MMHDEVSKQIMIEKIECQQDCCRYSNYNSYGEVETQVLKEPMLSSELRLML
jgi:hypothetical protein